MKVKNLILPISAFYGLLFGALGILGCKEGSKGNLPLASTPSIEKTDGWPIPNSYVGNIPVYDTFKNLEPMFKFDNDTTYVVNFWATWCKPCVKELPYFEELHQKNKKVKVVLVSLDFPKQLEGKLVPFVEKRKLNSKVVVLLDGKYNNWIDKVSPDWSGAIPATFIYKRDQNKLVGVPFENTEELLETIKPFL